MKQICMGVDDGGTPIDLSPAIRVTYIKSFLPDADESDIVKHVHGAMNGQMRGLGDAVAAGIKAVTFGMVKPCGGCQERQAALNKLVPFKNRNLQTVAHPGRGFGTAFRSTGGKTRFVSSAQLQQDIKLLLGMIPHDITAIAGIARSGLSVATMLSMYLHIPMLTIRQTMNDVVPTGNGWRLGGSRHIDPMTQKILIVDDTTLTGNSMKAVKPLIQAKFGNAITAVVYCNPAALVKPDIWAVDLGWPHILEWNMFNSILSPTMAVDFDGILCQDCPPWYDDDGPKYAGWMENAVPLYTPRRCHIPLVVTARLEKYRPITEAWLAKHTIKVDRLVMHPAATLQERQADDIAAYKARHFMAWGAGFRRKLVSPVMFVESNDQQARRIAKISGMLCVCPATAGAYQ